MWRKIRDWLTSSSREAMLAEKTLKFDLEAAQSFEYLIKSEAVIIDDNDVYIYSNIWLYYPNSKQYWRNQASSFFKRNGKGPNVLTINFRDMETGKYLDTFNCEIGIKKGKLSKIKNYFFMSLIIHSTAILAPLLFDKSP